MPREVRLRECNGDDPLTKEIGILDASFYEVRQWRLHVALHALQTADLGSTIDQTWSGQSYMKDLLESIVVWEVLLSA